MTHHTATEAIATIGIDLGKNTFHLIGMDARGSIVLRRKIARGQLPSCLANLPVCLIGLEACAGAHHIGRQLAALGHDVRLLPAQYVKPRISPSSGLDGGRSNGVLDGAMATMPNARWRKVICDSGELGA